MTDSTPINAKKFSIEKPAYISKAQQEIIANEQSFMKRLSSEQKVPLSKIKAIIHNIQVILQENKYTCHESYAFQLMHSAFENLSKEKALEFLESKELARNIVKPMLYNELIIEVAQLPIDELLDPCNELKNLLKNHRDYIIQTGLLPVTLKGPPLLESVFRRFYNTKVTTSKWPANPPKPPFTFSKSNPIPVLKYTNCSYEDADRVSGLSEKDEIQVERLRPILIDIAIDTVTLIENVIEGELNSKELESKFASILSKKLKNKDLAFLLMFDERFSIPIPDDCRGNEPLVIKNKFSSYLQSDGFLSNLINLVISIKHDHLDNPIRKAFEDPRYKTALKHLKEATSSSYLACYFQSLPQTNEMIELLNLMESKCESFRSNRNRSIKLMNKKLRAEIKKKRKRSITKAIAHKCKDQFVFNFTEVRGIITWTIVFKGKEIGRSIKKLNGYFLIRRLLINRGVPHSIESLDILIHSDYDPKSTKETELTHDEIKSIASKKDFYVPRKIKAEISTRVKGLMDKLKDKTLTPRERKNTTSEYHKQSEILRTLEENASIFKKKNDRVRKQIKDSMKKLSILSPELGKHLDASMKDKDGQWVYDPEKPINWI